MDGRHPAAGKLRDKLVRLKAQMQKLKALEAAVEASPDKQVSLTDPDTRLMVIGDRLTGVVGYNVQTAVETEHHLIIAHEVTNHVVRSRTAAEDGGEGQGGARLREIEVIADTGYYRGADLLACRDIGVTALAPRTNTSNAKAEGRFGKEVFVYLPDRGRLSLSGRRDADPPLRNQGRRSDHVRLLDHSLPGLSAERAMHHRTRAPRQTLGA